MNKEERQAEKLRRQRKHRYQIRDIVRKRGWKGFPSF